jgi:hypothetical protein
MNSKNAPLAARALSAADEPANHRALLSASCFPADHALPSALADVALVDVRTCAAAGQVSTNWWLERVQRGEAPAPVIRQPRFTRWRLADVRAFWIALADAGVADVDSGKQTSAMAKKASDAAHAKKRGAVHLVSPAAL